MSEEITLLIYAVLAAASAKVSFYLALIFGVCFAVDAVVKLAT